MEAEHCNHQSCLAHARPLLSRLPACQWVRTRFFTAARYGRTMRCLAAVLLLSSVAHADDAADWVRAKVALQRKGLDGSATPTGWSSGVTEAPTLPRFTPTPSLAPLVKAVRAGVVNVSTQNAPSGRSLGSGFVISNTGLLITNNHVVFKAAKITVRSAQGHEFEARVVGRDETTDVALLKVVPDATLTPLALGDSDALEVGDAVLAIGNPFGLETSVTNGIVSARERSLGVGPFDDFIQTNALINPGNSGGPLFDMKGRVIGVTTAMTSHGQGIGFAVPIDLVKDLLPNLLDDGRVERGWLGASVREVEEPSGAHHAEVDSVFAEGPAAQAGLEPMDIIDAVSGVPVTRYQQVLRRVALQPPGAQVTLAIRRREVKKTVTLTLRARPAAAAVQALASQGRIDAIGITLSESANGVSVTALKSGSTAERAGLRVGDVVLEVNHVVIETLRDLPAAMVDPASSDVVVISVKRGSAALHLVVPMH